MVAIIMEGSIGELLMSIYDDEEKSIEWLERGNINLAGAVPLNLINEGRADKVIRLLETHIHGH